MSAALPSLNDLLDQCRPTPDGMMHGWQVVCKHLVLALRDTRRDLEIMSCRVQELERIVRATPAPRKELETK